MSRYLNLTLVASCLLFLTTCKTPYFPLDQYIRIYGSEVYADHDVKQVSEGYYQLDVFAVDTIYARKRIKYYTTQPPGHATAEIISSLYVYFIDEMRFIYSEQKFDALDIKKDIGGKRDKIGLYRIYGKPIEVEGRLKTSYFVEMNFVKSKVKNDSIYDYAILVLNLSQSNDTLDFVAVDYPITSTPRSTPADEGTSFSRATLESGLENMQKNQMLNYSTTNMNFFAQWTFRNEPVSLLIDGKAYDRVLYQNLLSSSDHMIRTYFFQNQEVYKEIIHDDRSNNNLLTW